MSASDQREIEAACVVAASDPAAVFARLRGLDALGSHAVHARSSHDLLDRYLDTPAFDLWRRRLALRERRVNGRWLLALKGDLGPRERLEIEEPAGEAARGRIEAELRARDVRIRFDDLEVIQERDTTRERRALAAEGRAVAELALDAVTYRFDGREVRLYEVEVELEDDDVDLDAVLADLQRLAPELREWPYNKLATGAAIAAAVRRDELALRPDATLPPEAFDQLTRRLESSSG